MKIVLKIILFIKIIFSQVDYNHPELNWSSFSTDHFQIHFHDETEMSAREAATVAEVIYPHITKFYDYEPESKTHIVLLDPDDYSNGAAYYYDNKILIWASPLDFQLRGSHRWLQNVITHEFAHIVSLQKAMKVGMRIPGAYLQFMNYEEEKRPDVLYGYPNTLISYPIPGAIVPPWLAEGVAQYMYENADWDHWDTHRDMILRDRVINNNMLSFTEMNTFGKKGIGNESTYNSGFALSRFIANEYGPESLKLIMDELGSFTRFSVDKAIKNTIGINGHKLYNNFKSNIEERYNKLVAPILSNPVTGQTIIKNGTTNIFPKWHPNKNGFAYLSNKDNDFFGQTDLFYYDLDLSDDKKLVSGIFSAPTWNPNGDIIYYSKKSKFPDKHGSRYYDIYSFDTNNEEEDRLTFNSRGFNPVFIDRDSSIAYISTYDGGQDIFILDLKTLDSKKITNFNNRPMISHLTYDKLSYSLIFDITTHHYRDIAFLDLKSAEIGYKSNESLFDERNMTISEDSIEIFSKDKSGIYNLYMNNPIDSLSGYITNLTGGAFTPDISKNGEVLYSLYQNGAYTIALIDTIDTIDEDMIGYNRDFYKSNMGLSEPIVSLNTTKAKSYVDQFPNMFIMPKLMIDYGTVKPGFYFYSNEVINRLSLFGGSSINELNDVDLFFIFDFKRFYPTIFFETYYLTRNTTDKSKYKGIYDIDDDIKFRLVQFKSGLRIPIYGTLLEFSGIRQWYRAYIKQSIPSEGLEAGASYDYFRGWGLNANWAMDMVARRLDKGINPSKGFRLWANIDLEKNDFIEGLNLSDSGTLTEEYQPNNLMRILAGGLYHFEIPWLKRWTISSSMEFGWISNQDVDSFFHFYLGGLPGIKGYPFYSIQGSKSILLNSIFRIPLFREKHIKSMWMIWQNSTIGIGLQAGDAWTEEFKLKKSIGIEWRLNGFSFYNFPTAIELEYHHPMDRFIREIDDNLIEYGKEGRTYVKVLFDF